MRVVNTLPSINNNSFNKDWGGVSRAMAQIDSLAFSLVSEASNCRQILSMSVAGYAFQAVRAVGMFAGLGSKLSSVLGLGIEAATFGGASRIFSSSEEVSGTFFENWRRDVLHFAGLKTLGVALASHNVLFRHGVQGLGMVLGSDVTAYLGWTSKEEGSFGERMVHGMAMSVAMEAGNRLLRTTTGHVFERVTASIQRRLHAEESLSSNKGRGVDFSERIFSFSSRGNDPGSFKDAQARFDTYKRHMLAGNLFEAVKTLESFGEDTIRAWAQRLGFNPYMPGQGAALFSIAKTFTELLHQRVQQQGTGRGTGFVEQVVAEEVQASGLAIAHHSRSSGAIPAPSNGAHVAYERLCGFLPSMLDALMMYTGMPFNEIPSSMLSGAERTRQFITWAVAHNKLNEVRSQCAQKLNIPLSDETRLEDSAFTASQNERVSADYSSVFSGENTSDLHNTLNRLLPAQFDMLLMYIGMPHGLIPSANLPLASRTTQFMVWATSQNKLNEVESVLRTRLRVVF